MWTDDLGFTHYDDRRCFDHYEDRRCDDSIHPSNNYSSLHPHTHDYDHDLSMRHQRINDTVTAAQIAALDLLSWKWLFEVIGVVLKWTFFGVFILGYLIFRGMKMGVEKLFSKEKPQDV